MNMNITNATKKNLISSVAMEIIEKIVSRYYNQEKNTWCISVQLDLDTLTRDIDHNIGSLQKQIGYYFYLKDNSLSKNPKNKDLYPIAEEILQDIDLGDISVLKPYIKLETVFILRNNYFPTYQNMFTNYGTGTANTYLYTKIRKVFKLVGYGNLTQYPMISHYFPYGVDNKFIENIDNYLYYYSSIYNTRRPAKPYNCIKDSEIFITNDFLEYKNYANELAKKIHESISQALLVFSNTQDEFLSLYREYTLKKHYETSSVANIVYSKEVADKVVEIFNLNFNNVTSQTFGTFEVQDINGKKQQLLVSKSVVR